MKKKLVEQSNGKKIAIEEIIFIINNSWGDALKLPHESARRVMTFSSHCYELALLFNKRIHIHIYVVLCTHMTHKKMNLFSV